MVGRQTTDDGLLHLDDGLWTNHERKGMQELLDNQNSQVSLTWGQRNPVWAGLLSSALLFLAYFAFTVWIMTVVIESMRSTMQQSQTVLVSDGVWIKVWTWSTLIPILIPTLVTLFLYRSKREVVLYFELVKRGWFVTFISMMLLYVIAAVFFKVGNFIPVDNQALKLVAAIILISTLAFVVNLILSMFFRKK